MSDFVQMDIFFFVTTVSVVVLLILFSILTVYLIKISRDVRYISKKAKHEADLITEDLSDLRENIKTEGAKLKHFTSFFNKLRRKKK